MVRKRLKANGLATSTASIPTRLNPKSPRQRLRRANENFDGKLSHASPISPHSKITKYFHPQEDELKPCDERAPPTMILRTSPRKLLTQANLNASVLPPPPPLGLSPVKPRTPPSHTEDVSPQDAVPPGRPTPHKITSPSPVPILRSSPVSALCTLSIHSPRSNGPQTAGKKSKRCLGLSNHVSSAPNAGIKGNQVSNSFRGNQVTASSGIHGNQGSQARITEFFPVRRSIRKTKKTVLQERQKSLEEAVLNNQEDGLEVHMFEGKGRGVVTKRQFRRGEFVVEYAGQLIPLEVARQREAEYARDQNTGCYMYYFRHGNSQYCVDATAESPRLGRLVNHSRAGNLTTKTIEINHEPHLVLIAKEDIAPGTEVTYDYGDRSKESLRYHPWLLN